MKKNWILKPNTYGQDSHLLKVGKWTIGQINYDGLSDRSIAQRYVISCNLPDIQQSKLRYHSVESAKIELELIFDDWIEGLRYE